MKPTMIRKMILSAACLSVVLSASLVSTPSVQAATASVQASVSSTQKANTIVSYAQSLKGKVKYKFGVNNPSKLIFDCSSFTKFVYAKQGVSLKWGSVAQSKQGKYVSKSKLKKGDLLFFSVSTPGKINHVGIYMGNGKFIHNTTGSVKGIAISDLNSSNYKKRYITARRVL
ncbi:C40 family peptidase [Paenibacillus mendelii]|uniref:C40 family peptidase n=1 Tax=Paenibacillus mendelii TaxID=206163 RepID=A0ABV6J5V0_9BACL|nr:C40 family peptidase [Paenibacillus mendelii]MCQ6560041.1 C40 family peptidase [Paenibacillus mendelii]